MAEETETTASSLPTVPPSPPNISNLDDAGKIAALNNWAWDFYKAVALYDTYVQSSGQFDVGDFDPASLPDPASSTIAKAQQTANEAYTLAAQAKALADANAALLAAIGALTLLEATISNPPTQAEVQAVADLVDEIINAAAGVTP